MTARGSWKALERRLARDMGTERIAVTGQKDGADFETPMFAFQVKMGQRQPEYLKKWLTGIVQNSVRRGLIGVVCWKPKFALDDDTLVVLRWKDWVELHGKVYAEPAVYAPKEP